jgi:5-methylcytosine-specific restriction endonuclease McrA
LGLFKKNIYALNKKPIINFRMLTLKLDSSYKPLDIIDSCDALSMVWRGKARMLESYPNRTINTTHVKFPEPSVIVLDRFVDFKFFQVGCNRRNIYDRDQNICQYCRKCFSPSKLTLDHVIPKSKGGPKSWENLVTSCKSCNQKKGNLHLSETGMNLVSMPKKPKYQLVDYLGPNIPEKWKVYLEGFVTS